MTTVTDSEELVDEIAKAISDTLDMDWKPSWAAPNIIAVDAIINRERRLAYEAGAKAMRDAVETEMSLSALNAITAHVLSYRPKDKGLAAKKTERRLKRQAKKEAHDDRESSI